MDGLCDLLSMTARPGIKYNEKVDGFETLELYSHKGSVKLRTRKIANDGVMAWLNRSDAVDENDCDIVRVVTVRRNIIINTSDPWEVDISKKNLDLVLEYFDLKKNYQLVADGSVICLPIQHRPGSKKQHSALALFGHASTLIWTHDLMKTRTEVLWCGSDEIYPFSMAGPVFESQKKLARHPMFMALVVALLISQATQAMIEPICAKINQVENRTQHCPSNLIRHSIAEGNYAALSAMMSGCATRLACLAGRHQNLDDIYNSILEHSWPQGVEQPGWAETVVNEVNECVSILRRITKGQEQRVRYLSQRADIQLTAVSHFPTVFFFPQASFQTS